MPEAEEIGPRIYSVGELVGGCGAWSKSGSAVSTWWGRSAICGVPRRDTSTFFGGRALVDAALARATAAGHAETAVISAVGTRDYYRALGFRDGVLYQHR